ncbi:MAG: DUF421 domain-containing protein [Hyphomicrobiaceae bacterium]
MFSMTTSPLEIVARVLAVYAALFVMLRIVGKRHVGELSPFDLLVLLILSESVQNAMMAEEKSLTGGLLAAATLFGMSQLVGYLTWRSKRVERAVDGVPRVLVWHGVLDAEALAAECITRTELLEALRKEGYSSLGSVRYAILENDGAISVAGRLPDRAD